MGCLRLILMILLFLCNFSCKNEVLIRGISSAKLGEVTAVYPSFTKFLDYVRTADTTATCDTGVDDSYDECIQAGLKREVVVTGETSCSGLSLVEYLGVFTWQCSVINGTATFRTTDFASGKGLKDLLEETSFKNNKVEVYSGGSKILYTALSIWWTDTVQALAGQTTLNTSGIYTVATSSASDAITISAASVGIVTLGSATLTYNTGTVNIAGLGVQPILIYSTQNFTYLEVTAEFYNSGSTTNSVGIYNSGAFARYHQLSLTKGTYAFLHLGNAGTISGTTTCTAATVNGIVFALGDNNLLKGAVTVEKTFVFSSNSSNNTIDADLTITGQLSFSGAANSNTFNGDVSVSNCTNCGGIALNSSGNTFNGSVTMDTVTGNNNNLQISAANNTFNGTVHILNNTLGYGLRINSAGNVFNGAVNIENVPQAIYLDGASGAATNQFNAAITIDTVTSNAITLEDSASNTFSSISIDMAGAAGTGILLDNADSNTLGAISIQDGTTGIALTNDSDTNSFSSTIGISDMTNYSVSVGDSCNDNSLTNITSTNPGANDLYIDSFGGTNPNNNTVTKVNHPAQFASCGGDSIVGFTNTTSCP